MAAPGGLSAQLGFVAESTYGTRVAPSKFVELVSESLALTVERIESQGLRAGRRTLLSTQWSAGRRFVSGDIVVELSNLGQGQLWAAAFGTTASSGAGPYVHTYSPGDMATSLTIQVGRPDIGGTVRVFEYTGCMINTWEVSCTAGEIAQVTFGILGQDETTSQTLATATYAAGYAPMTFVHGVLSLGGSNYDVNSATVAGDNGLADDRYYLRGSGLRQKPLEANWRNYTAELGSHFTDLTAYARYTAGTEAALTLTFTNGANIFQLAGNLRSDGTTPAVSGPALLEMPITGRFVASGATDDTALKVVRTTTEATAIA